jgi:hypothetical protein
MYNDMVLWIFIIFLNCKNMDLYLAYGTFNEAIFGTYNHFDWTFTNCSDLEYIL